MCATLYESDYYTWLVTQVEILKKGDLNKMDINNIIEELEEMGRSEKRALESYLVVIVTHLLKWKYQPECRSSGWRGSINVSRGKLERLLRDSPGLKSKIDEIYEGAYKYSRRDAISETGLNDDKFPSDNPFSLVNVLDLDFYPE